MSIYEIWITYLTLYRKELTRIIRIWPQSLLPSVITSILYFMIFGKIIGGKVGEISGVSYIQYIAPGLIMLSMLTNTYSNVASSFFGARFSRSIEELLISPCSNHTIILGYTLSGMTRGCIVGTLVACVAVFFHALTIAHVFLFVFSFITCTFLFGLGGLLNGIFSRKFDDTMLFTVFILTPLIYLGGVFYNVTELDGIWQHLALLNPLYYIIELFRYACIGSSPLSEVYKALSIIILMAIVMYCLAYYLLKKGIRLKN